MTIIDSRLNALDIIELKEGAHQDFEAGVCLLELSSWLAGEPFSDHPECVSPVLGAFGRSWNDQLNDADRQRLKPYAARFVGTKSTIEVEDARSWMACDWLVRTFTPVWLRLAGLDDDAVALESLGALTSTELVDAALPTIRLALEHGAQPGTQPGTQPGAQPGAQPGTQPGTQPGPRSHLRCSRSKTPRLTSSTG